MMYNLLNFLMISLTKPKNSKMLLLTIILKFSKMLSLIKNSCQTKFLIFQKHSIIIARLYLVQNYSYYQEKISRGWSSRKLMARSTNKLTWLLKYFHKLKIPVILSIHYLKLQKKIISIKKKKL